jgi:hypothetical protein
MSFSARETLTDAPIHAGVPGDASGRQRKQGRNPASAAAAADGKYRTFFGFGCGAGQTGRQYTPVVVTPMKKRPSKRASRASRALSHAFQSSAICIWTDYG